MDRAQIFTEYGHILEDSFDWLSYGYRRKHGAQEIVLPKRIGNSTENTDVISNAVSTAPLTAEVHRSVQVPAEGVSIGGAPVLSREIDPAAESRLSEIFSEISACRNCNLYLIRQSTVPGIGHPGSTLMVVTPPPADGAGELDVPLPRYEQEYLEKWLTALGLRPGTDTFITPAVKCRTPGGRPPHAEESAACSGYLRRQYKEIRPKAVLALGAAACAALTGNSGDFPSLVGRDWTWGSIPALVLWTPAEVLANPGRLRKPVWESLQRLKASWNAVP